MGGGRREAARREWMDEGNTSGDWWRNINSLLLWFSNYYYWAQIYSHPHQVNRFTKYDKETWTVCTYLMSSWFLMGEIFSTSRNQQAEKLKSDGWWWGWWLWCCMLMLCDDVMLWVRLYVMLCCAVLWCCAVMVCEMLCVMVRVVVNVVVRWNEWF